MRSLLQLESKQFSRNRKITNTDYSYEINSYSLGCLIEEMFEQSCRDRLILRIQ